jgi:hypothetical protein
MRILRILWKPGVISADEAEDVQSEWVEFRLLDQSLRKYASAFWSRGYFVLLENSTDTSLEFRSLSVDLTLMSLLPTCITCSSA